MARKFHVSPDGKSRRCRAIIRACDYGEGNHYSSKAEAMKAAIEKQLSADIHHPVEDNDWETETGIKYQALISYLDDNSRKGDRLGEGLLPGEAFYRDSQNQLTLNYDAVISYVRSRGYPELVAPISHAADNILIQKQRKRPQS